MRSVLNIIKLFARNKYGLLFLLFFLHELCGFFFNLVFCDSDRVEKIICNSFLSVLLLLRYRIFNFFSFHVCTPFLKLKFEFPDLSFCNLF